MYKEITFSEDQKGFGLAVTNLTTGTRALVGIFETRQEAEEVGEFRRKLGRVKRPSVVAWTKKNYDRYDYVFNK